MTTSPRTSDTNTPPASPTDSAFTSSDRGKDTQFSKIGLRAAKATRLTIVPLTGIGEVRPSDDIAELLWHAGTGQVRDGDILVITSKIISKSEGQLVAAPTDPDECERVRRALVDQETVRLVAQKGRTKIVENRLGIVAAAAGVDTSNVRPGEIALLPRDPDASAAAIAAAFAQRGRHIGVLITDTQGRTWRRGVTDVAIGAARIAVLDDYRGQYDQHGHQLMATEVAVADELAAAADLVKGKLRNTPVALVRGLDHLVARTADATSTGAQALIRPAAEDLFRLGTDLAIEWGRRDAQASVPEGHSQLHQDARSVITAWRPPLAEIASGQYALAQAFLTLLALRGDATARSCGAGHITASTVVLSADLQHTLLTLHPRVGKWLQLGGHCEAGDETLHGSAVREAREESGIDDLFLLPDPIHLDIHPITCSLGVPTRHFDVRFVAIAPPGAIPVRSSESKDLRFWPLDQLPHSDDEGLRQAITAASVCAAAATTVRGRNG